MNSCKGFLLQTFGNTLQKQIQIQMQVQNLYYRYKCKYRYKYICKYKYKNKCKYRYKSKEDLLGFQDGGSSPVAAASREVERSKLWRWKGRKTAFEQNLLLRTLPLLHFNGTLQMSALCCEDTLENTQWGKHTATCALCMMCVSMCISHCAHTKT